MSSSAVRPDPSQPASRRHLPSTTGGRAAGRSSLVVHHVQVPEAGAELLVPDLPSPCRVGALDEGVQLLLRSTVTPPTPPSRIARLVRKAHTDQDSRIRQHSFYVSSDADAFGNVVGSRMSDRNNTLSVRTPVLNHPETTTPLQHPPRRFEYPLTGAGRRWQGDHFGFGMVRVWRRLWHRRSTRYSERHGGQ